MIVIKEFKLLKIFNINPIDIIIIRNQLHIKNIIIYLILNLNLSFLLSKFN